MSDCLPERTSLQKSITKARLGIGIIRLYCQGLFPLWDRFIDAAFCQKRMAKVVVGVGVVRLQLYCFLIVNDGFIELSFSGQSVAQIGSNKRRTQIVVRLHFVQPDL